MHVNYQLATLKKGSMSIASYYQRAKLLGDTRAATGRTLTSSEFITYLLAGLGKDYKSIVTSITTRVDPLSLAQLYSHLLIHKSRLAHQHTSITAFIKLLANATLK